jgi:protoheme IX farnesyltransferase
VNSVLLVASATLPWAFGELGAVYGLIALAFGGRFLWLSWALLKDPSTALARKTFLGSMLYLLGVFVAVLLDKHWPL